MLPSLNLVATLPNLNVNPNRRLHSTTGDRFFLPALFDRLLREIRAFSQHENESLSDAWLRMKEMLRNCHGHNLSKGNIIKVFYHGLNETTQEVINVAVGGIFLYKTPNQAYQLLEDKVLLKLDWAKNQKTKPSLKKTVSFADEEMEKEDSVMATKSLVDDFDTFITKLNSGDHATNSHADQSKLAQTPDGWEDPRIQPMGEPATKVANSDIPKSFVNA
ncbi:reverse transcriptase domain-containing protein, partial [Tanacetum coccineum]